MTEIIDKTGLEDTVDNETRHRPASTANIETQTFDKFLTQFSNRYTNDFVFKEIVHLYLGLTSFDKMKLFLWRKVSSKVYTKKTDKLIYDYAKKTWDGIKKAEEIQNAKSKIEEEGIAVVKYTSELEQISSKYQEANNDYYKAVDASDKAKKQVIDKFEENLIRINNDAQSMEKEILRETDAEVIVGTYLEKHIKSSNLICLNETGELTFDEGRIADRIGELFLDETIAGIEQKDGRGFMSKLVESYHGVFSHWDDINSINQLSNVNWVLSAIQSRTKGYKYPTYPYLVVAKYEDAGRCTIDTAFAIDSSGSMMGTKIETAKKTALGGYTLMRRLNPRNNTYMCHYNSGLYPLDKVGMIKQLNAEGYTRTDKALSWFIETLYDRGPSIASLITDGQPEDVEHDSAWAVEKSVEAARKLSEYNNILLRIFLIDGDNQTKDIIRKIGKAAGPKTKVIPVESSMLGSSVISDMNNAIRDMYNINDF